MGVTRVMFARHREGHIFPVLMHVTRGETEFAGIFQRVASADDFVLFLADSLVVTAASQLEGSLALFGVREPWRDAYSPPV
jgi:hypothetical protein